MPVLVCVFVGVSVVDSVVDVGAAVAARVAMRESSVRDGHDRWRRGCILIFVRRDEMLVLFNDVRSRQLGHPLGSFCPIPSLFGVD